jgi:hypothetical protein
VVTSEILFASYLFQPPPWLGTEGLKKNIGAQMQLIQMILALAEALGIINEWVNKLTIGNTKRMREKGNVEFDKAMAKARSTSSAEDLANSIGADLDD